MDPPEILQAVLKITFFFSLKIPTSIGRTILYLDGARACFSPFARARSAQSDFLGHILDQTPQTEVQTKNQLPRYTGSGPIELTCTDNRQTDRRQKQVFLDMLHL